MVLRHRSIFQEMHPDTGAVHYRNVLPSDAPFSTLEEYYGLHPPSEQEKRRHGIYCLVPYNTPQRGTSMSGIGLSMGRRMRIGDDKDGSGCQTNTDPVEPVYFFPECNDGHYRRE